MRKHLIAVTTIFIFLILFTITPRFIFDSKNLDSKLREVYETDSKTEHLLLNMDSSAKKFYEGSHKLPDDLNQVKYLYNFDNKNYTPPNDVIYTVKGNLTYELCTTFSSEKKDEGGASSYIIDQRRSIVFHPKGDYCFNIDLTEYVKQYSEYEVTQTTRRNEQFQYNIQKILSLGGLIEISGKKTYVALLVGNGTEWKPAPNYLKEFLMGKLPQGMNMSLKSEADNFYLLFEEPASINTISILFSNCPLVSCGGVTVRGNYEDGTDIKDPNPRGIEVYPNKLIYSPVKFEKKVKVLRFDYTQGQANNGTGFPTGTWEELNVILK